LCNRLLVLVGLVLLLSSCSFWPMLSRVAVAPAIISPNADGVDDVTLIRYRIGRAANLSIYFLDGAGQRYYALYDGGVHDQNGRYLAAEPPPDGTYALYLEAEDRVGNRVVVSSTLTISAGGRPLAEIAGGSIDWQGEMNGKVGVPVGRRLCFTAVVINIGPVPLRTSGPWPGQAYRLTQSYHDLAATYDEPSWAKQRGVWRFGINYDTTGVDFPFRWAIGRPEDLEQRVIDGQAQYYLMPGRRGMVYGCIQFDVAPPVGTDHWWGGLIHESVQIAANNVDTVSVLVGRP